MSALLLLLACRPDPGAPAYPDPEPWLDTEDPEFYPDPVDPGEERLSLGAFYESAADEVVPIDDATSHFYIYESTFTLASTDDRWEGYVADTFTQGALGWFGGGIHWDTPRDLSGWDALHLVVSTSDDAGWDVGVNGGGVEARRAVADYGLVADGAWHELQIPLADFAGADMGAVSVPLLLVGEGGQTGDRFVLDAVYYTRGGAR